MYNSRIEGIFFKGPDTSGVAPSSVYTGVGALLIWGKWHVKNIRIRNCVFEKNIGRIAGAAFVCNASKVFFESCVFAENTSVSGGQMEDICAVDPDGVTRCRSINSQNWSGGAVTIYEFDSCGSEVDFDGCVFWNNSTRFDLAPDPSAADAGGGTIAVFGGVIAAGRAAGASRPVKIANCTFNNNHVVNGSVPASHCAGSVYKDSSALLTSLTPVILINTICYGNVNAGISELRNISLAGDSVSYCTNFHTFANPGTYQTFRAPEVSYCNVQDASLGASQNSIGNFNHNPCFEGDIDSNGIVELPVPSPDVPNADGIWGTLDDGLVLSYWGRDAGGSVESNRTRNSGIFRGLPETKDSTLKDYYKPVFFDAAGRPKLGDVDIGGYESVIKIMCVGDDNTRGSNEFGDTAWCYRATLKDMLREKQWHVDFSGATELAPIGGTWHTELKEKLRLDPARNPGVTDKYDVQHEGYEEAFIETFSASDSIKTLLDNNNPDIILLMAGTINIKNDDTVAVDIVTKEVTLVDKINQWLIANNRKRNERFLLLGNLPVYEGKNKYVTNANLLLSQQAWGDKIDGDLVDVNGGMSLNMLQSSKKYRCKKSGLEHIGKKWFRALVKKN